MISFCISTVQFSILINGCPICFFRKLKRSSSGGPSLSSDLCDFNGGIESIDVKPVDGGFISGFQVGGSTSNGLRISHLLEAKLEMCLCWRCW